MTGYDETMVTLFSFLRQTGAHCRKKIKLWVGNWKNFRPDGSQDWSKESIKTFVWICRLSNLHKIAKSHFKSRFVAEIAASLRIENERSSVILSLAIVNVGLQSHHGKFLKCQNSHESVLDCNRNLFISMVSVDLRRKQVKVLDPEYVFWRESQIRFSKRSNVDTPVFLRWNLKHCMAESSGLYGGVSNYSRLYRVNIFIECSTYDIFILKKAQEFCTHSNFFWQDFCCRCCCWFPLEITISTKTIFNKTRLW